MESFLPGNLNKRLYNVFGNLKIIANEIPNRTVYISPGGFWNLTDLNSSYISFNGGYTSELIFPITDERWSIITLTTEGLIAVIDGNESDNPILPTIPINQIPLAAIYFHQDSHVITSDHIYDIRSFLSNPVNNTKSKINILIDGNQTSSYHNINLISGDNITLTSSNNISDQIDISISSLNSIIHPAQYVIHETNYNQIPNPGTSISYSRGDHTHGSPLDSLINHLSTYDHSILLSIPDILSDIQNIKNTLSNILSGIDGGTANS